MIPGESTRLAVASMASTRTRCLDAVDVSALALSPRRRLADHMRVHMCPGRTEAVSRRRPCPAGENTIPYNEEFRLFLTTKMPNPHYSPEVQVKISLVNFTVTQSGLEEQLLGPRGVRIAFSDGHESYSWGVSARPPRHRATPPRRRRYCGIRDA